MRYLRPTGVRIPMTSWPLSATVEPFGTEEDDWKAEKITYKAAYGDELAIAYLFLPKKVKPPFQTVIVFPGSTP